MEILLFPFSFSLSFFLFPFFLFFFLLGVHWEEIQNLQGFIHSHFVLVWRICILNTSLQRFNHPCLKRRLPYIMLLVHGNWENPERIWLYSLSAFMVHLEGDEAYHHTSQNHKGNLFLWKTRTPDSTKVTACTLYSWVPPSGTISVNYGCNSFAALSRCWVQQFWGESCVQ